MGIYKFEKYEPKIDSSAFVHPEAVLIGDVSISENCFIGPGAVLRADWGIINVGAGSNIQDRVVIHVKPEHWVVLGANSHIGHGDSTWTLPRFPCFCRHGCHYHGWSRIG